MVGRELQATARVATPQLGNPVLAVRGLTKAGQYRDVSFDVRRGEIVGLTGLMGAGRTELVNAVYGLSRPDGGSIHVHGRSVRIHTPAAAIRHGIGMVSEDRQESGLVLKMSVKHNLTLASLRRCGRAGFISRRAEARVADEHIRHLSIKTPHRDQSVAHLSGGNQQKVVLARALSAGPDILILDEPTRGIDIAAKAEVHALIQQLARDGKAIILVSSELPEILALGHRVLVMRKGVIAAELDPRRTTQEEILNHAMPA
jgi:ABC-type sugar transport system ATPase subunit